MHETGKNELVQQRTGSNFAESRRALQAVAEALTSTSAGERAPPRGTLRCSIMPHQRLALGWMCKREEGCIPVGATFVWLVLIVCQRSTGTCSMGVFFLYPVSL